MILNAKVGDVVWGYGPSLGSWKEGFTRPSPVERMTIESVVEEPNGRLVIEARALKSLRVDIDDEPDMGLYGGCICRFFATSHYAELAYSTALDKWADGQELESFRAHREASEIRETIYGL